METNINFLKGDFIMKNSYERMEKEIKEFKKLFVSNFGEEALQSMGEEELKAMQCLLRLVDASTDLMKDWTETMEEQDRKLTQILALLERANLSKD